MSRRAVTIVARVVLLSPPGSAGGAGRRLLVARHRRAGGSEFWCLPGGKVDEGERVADAAVRELREEAGLEVEVGGIVWVLDRPEARRLELLYAGRLLHPITGPRPPAHDKHLVGVTWRSLALLAREDFRPAALIAALRQDRLPAIPDGRDEPPRPA